LQPLLERRLAEGLRAQPKDRDKNDCNQANHAPKPSLNAPRRHPGATAAGNTMR
jgi:hypothetical protein